MPVWRSDGLPPLPTGLQPPVGRWTNHGGNSAPSAAIDRGDRSLNHIWHRNGTAVIGIAGLGGAAGVTRISVDGRSIPSFS